jgi:acyl-CoA reductase-like NAD-dependent aldehyde dehydrogenase
MTIDTVNPYNNKIIGKYEMDSVENAISKINKVREEQKEWSKSLEERVSFFKNVVKPNFEKNIDNISKLMTEEMGKPISQSISEVKKSIRLIDYLIENAYSIFSPEYVPTEAKKSYIRFDPIGVVLSIEPWNFPLWQAARAIFPALLAGNGVVLKHASLVTGISLKIEELIELPVFKSLVINGNTASSMIKYVDGVAFTGSTPTGTGIAEIAGKELKKVVMELGGSDPFIVLRDADLDKTAKNAAMGRLQNNGQSCIASKRFIVEESIFKDFHEKMKEEFSKIKVGDPMDQSTYLGPLASSSQKETVMKQISYLKNRGRIEILGNEEGNIVPPTIVQTDENYQEEIFGPVAILRKFKNVNEAIALANDTPFGLGTSIWGSEREAEKIIPEIQAGMVYVNSIVFSDPRLPFGGIKKSGLGRELSRYGSREFTNVKTVYINW